MPSLHIPPGGIYPKATEEGLPGKSHSTMTAPTAGPSQPDDSMRGSIHICVTAIVAGVPHRIRRRAVPLVLQTADHLRVDLVDWAHALRGPAGWYPWRRRGWRDRWPP